MHCTTAPACGVLLLLGTGSGVSRHITRRSHSGFDCFYSLSLATGRTAFNSDYASARSASLSPPSTSSAGLPSSTMASKWAANATCRALIHLMLRIAKYFFPRLRDLPEASPGNLFFTQSTLVRVVLVSVPLPL